MPKRNFGSIFPTVKKIVQRFMQTLSRGKISWLIIAFTLLLLSYLLLFINLHKIQKQYKLLSQTYTVLNRLEKLELSIKEMGIEYRNAIISKSSGSIDDYSKAKKQNSTQVNEMGRLVAENPLQIKNFNQLNLLNDSLRSGFDKNLSEGLKTTNKDTIFSYLRYGLLSDEIMPAINKVRVMENNELNLLNERNAELEKFSSTINFINLIFLGIVFLIIIWTFYNYNEEYRARIEGAKREARYKKELEEKIEKLNETNNSLDEANKKINELKQVEKFSASGRVARTIAHEVRNPLTNINLASNELATTLNTEDDKMMLSIITRNSSRINDLISNLLNATRATELDLKPILANELLEKVLVLANDRLELKEIDVIKNYQDESCLLKVDEEKMVIALLNIVVNAIEAMDAKEIRQLNISIQRTSENYCKIRIEDTGEGMSEDQVANIFDPFFSQKTNGMGLGLTNTQNIIYSHTGSIQVESEKGKGTIFTIQLPVFS